MRQTNKILSIMVSLVFANVLNAAIVDISVTTDKFTYQPGESVIVSITAHNPNPQAIGLTFGPFPASYTMDGVYNWVDWQTPVPILVHIWLPANDSRTWHITNDSDDMQRYPLNPGWHSVVGEVLAQELAGNNQSSTRQFYVTPEPATLLLLGLGGLMLRKNK